MPFPMLRRMFRHDLQPGIRSDGVCTDVAVNGSVPGLASAGGSAEHLGRTRGPAAELDEGHAMARGIGLDFGGGTSDFSLLRVGPSLRGRVRQPEDIIGNAGVAVAGDAFDARIVRHVVADRLGRGSMRQVLMGKQVEMPNWIYRDLERWHQLSFLRSHKTMGFLHETVRRHDFETWIAKELGAIAGCVDGLLEETRTPIAEVDRVFMTGGSAFVPALRRLFADRFGEQRLTGGGELISVASGLALRARDLAAAEL